MTSYITMKKDTILHHKTNVGQIEHVKSTSNINIGQGGPINTADILEQLKKMKENLQKQIN